MVWSVVCTSKSGGLRESIQRSSVEKKQVKVYQL
jgi:hypothetical protein